LPDGAHGRAAATGIKRNKGRLRSGGRYVAGQKGSTPET
jgi:hypothetical protein